MRLLAAAMLPALFLGAAIEARAAFHIAHISEVMTSLGGDASIQFVEIEMAAGGQTITTNSVLGAFAADGDYLGDILVVPSNLSNSGSGVSWLMATAEFAATTGLDPDFVFPAGLPTESGMVCWGGPGSVPPDPGSWGHTDPNQYVDCLSYGDYGGATAAGSGAPARGSPDGHSLQRVNDTDDNETDFDCGDPATPTTNDGISTEIVATVPCLINECGNGIPGPTLPCDDGNTVDGDGCSTDCIPEICGDGILENNGAAPDEECEDGNTVSGDGCSGLCVCEAVCGDGLVNEPCGEQCDDGNTVAGDGCDDACQSEPVCGNGIIEGTEECDDGNTLDGDGCESSCTLIVESRPLPRNEQACVNELNKRFAGVLKARNKVALKCLKNFAKGKEADFELCAFGDDPKVAKAKAKTSRGEEKKCADVLPVFGAGGAAVANLAADEQALAALRDVLGNPPSPALKAETEVARCQAELTKNLGRIEDALAKAANRAKKAGLRGKKVAPIGTSLELAETLDAAFGDAKVASLTAKAASKAVGRCPAGDLSAAFPGICDATSASALADCAAARARCRVCLAFETADDLDLDCDTAAGVACPGP